MPRVATLVAIAVVLWLGAWLANVGPVGVDLGPTSPNAAAIDLGLIGLFGAQHSVMARPAWKRLMGLGESRNRSVYLLGTSVALVIVFLFWRPMPALIWEGPGVLGMGQALGAGLAAWAVMALDARAFLGLREAPPGLCRTGPYRFMRHPILIGILAVLWCVPRISQGHLLFSVGMTVYGLVGTWFESRDLNMLD